MKRLKKLLYLSYTFIFLLQLKGQSSLPNNHKTYLIQTKSQQWLRNQQLIGLVCIDSNFGLYHWRPKLDESVNTLQQLAKAIQVDLVIQPNHRVQRRYSTNDPLVGNQKYLDVINMPRCWNESRTGLNRNGDTMVVAVVDDGMDTSHPDLQANIWINYAEKPWDGIDNDGNGYIDDYYGWNGGDNIPIIFNSESIFYGHGTQVAGVLGAVGDNGSGITGVMMHIKMMPLLCYSNKGGDGELGIVRSMLYAYRQKQRWISSSGTKGANVVAMNMSVGIDNTFANETPIWCAMYDSLKNVGIVCAAATTNSKNNVDSVGDIPSLCPSNALLITSSVGLDKQWVESGYGKPSVDLAAPGDAVYTTEPIQNAAANPYVAKSGTSFAAPQVTAAIGWLNGVVCKEYLKLMAANPDSGVALMRGWILNSVDKNSSLTNRTVSGGVLDVYGAWKLMDAWCMLYEPTYSLREIVGVKPVVFPNPAGFDAAIEIQFPLSTNIEVTIFDAVGRQILYKLCLTNSKIRLTGLNAGVYSVDSKIAGRRYSTKLVVQ